MTAARTSAAPLRARLKAETRSAILDAAERVFGESGLDGGSMQRIAAEAGVAVGTLYNYFEHRDALLGSLLASRRQELLARVDRDLETAERAFEPQLAAYVSAVYGHARAHRSLLALLSGLDGAALRMRLDPPRGEGAIGELHRRAKRLIAAGIAEGRLRQADAALLADLLIACIRAGIARELGPARGAASQDAVGATVTFFLHGAASA